MDSSCLSRSWLEFQLELGASFFGSFPKRWMVSMTFWQRYRRGIIEFKAWAEYAVIAIVILIVIVKLLSLLGVAV